MLKVVFLTVISIIRDALNKNVLSDAGWYCRIPMISFESSIDTLYIVTTECPNLFNMLSVLLT